MTDLMAKDLDLATAYGAAQGVPLTLTATARQALTAASTRRLRPRGLLGGGQGHRVARRARARRSPCEPLRPFRRWNSTVGVGNHRQLQGRVGPPRPTPANSRSDLVTASRPPALILAADHRGRGVVTIERYADYLAALGAALPHADGILATAQPLADLVSSGQVTPDHTTYLSLNRSGLAGRGGRAGRPVGGQRGPGRGRRLHRREAHDPHRPGRSPHHRGARAAGPGAGGGPSRRAGRAGRVGDLARRGHVPRRRRHRVRRGGGPRPGRTPAEGAGPRRRPPARPGTEPWPGSWPAWACPCCSWAAPIAGDPTPCLAEAATSWPGAAPAWPSGGRCCSTPTRPTSTARLADVVHGRLTGPRADRPAAPW